MNVDMTKVNELIAERDAFMEDYNKKASVHDEQYNNYIRAYKTWRNSIAEKVRNIINDYNEDIDIIFDSYDGYNIKIEYGRYSSNAALKWDITINYDKETGKVTYASNSWSGMDITTSEKIANLEYSVNLIKKITTINWKDIAVTFDDNKPNRNDFVNTKAPERCNRNWDKEIFFAMINAYKDANVIFKGTDEYGYDAYYKVIKETAKRYTVAMLGRYDIEDSKKNGTLANYVNDMIQSEYCAFGISKDKFYDRVYDKKAVLGVEMIEY